ncbi:hypothetical protein ACQP2F_41860 [Actinoplanes sp. CA-030573]|uniref:hypothetical protein n=1 Tax=Actinoplanes sp. CA-030573 TaxID=3239898 RepID=UPI003D8AA0E4
MTRARYVCFVPVYPKKFSSPQHRTEDANVQHSSNVPPTPETSLSPSLPEIPGVLAGIFAKWAISPGTLTTAAIPPTLH